MNSEQESDDFGAIVLLKARTAPRAKTTTDTQVGENPMNCSPRAGIRGSRVLKRLFLLFLLILISSAGVSAELLGGRMLVFLLGMTRAEALDAFLLRPEKETWAQRDLDHWKFEPPLRYVHEVTFRDGKIVELGGTILSLNTGVIRAGTPLEALKEAAVLQSMPEPEIVSGNLNEGEILWRLPDQIAPFEVGEPVTEELTFEDHLIRIRIKDGLVDYIWFSVADR